MGNIIFVKFRYREFYDGIICIANEGCHARITNDLAIIFFVFISIKSLFINISVDFSTSEITESWDRPEPRNKLPSSRF